MNPRFAILLLAAIFFKTGYAGISCFTCINAASNEECNEIGKIVECAENEQSCQNELRLSTPDGFGYLITKRCKQPLACENNQNQNLMPAWNPTQCNIDFRKNSVCRCCCLEDLCNSVELPCSDIKRCPARGNIQNGNVVCTSNNFLNSTCYYQCNDGYELLGESIIGCVESGSELVWDAKEPRCTPSVCKTSLSSPINGEIMCSETNKVGSVCTFACSTGFKLVGRSSLQCQGNGVWSGQTPRCDRITCGIQQTAPKNGKVTCSSENFFDSICGFSCSEGFFLAGTESTTCQLNGRWSNPAPVCQRITCDPQHSNPRNGQVSCSDGNFFRSTCSFTCNVGYHLVGSIESTCRSDFRWSAAPPTCQQITCDPRPFPPTHGSISCSDRNLFASVCVFSCNEGFYLNGEETTTCQDDFSWSYPSPVCEIITCPELESLENGQVKCTDDNAYGSICKFQCNEGFFMEGEKLATCETDFNWSSPSPVCQAYTCGPTPPSPINGGVSCSNGNKSFSECSFTCGDGSDRWEFKGESISRCLFSPARGTYAWNSETPCCARRCPPFAQVDLFVVLDSSSSVGKDNWNKTVHFVAGVISDFVVSQNDMLVGAIRYNKVVDVNSEIQIGTYTEKRATMEAIINLPYDGSGTNTGNALQYVVDEMLTAPGNRPTVQDMVLLVTDGISRDDTKIPAQLLRATGTNVVVLGISNQKGGLKQEDILDIAADPAKTVMLTSGFDGLTQDLVEVIIKQVCTNPCDRQNQYGDFGLNFGL